MHAIIRRRTHLTAIGRARDGLYEPVLADSEREAVADLLQYLENVRTRTCFHLFGLLTL
jgi:vacuolar protein 8